MISDISAIAYDWLSTGNPILLTKPVEKKAVVEDFPLVDKLYSITTIRSSWHREANRRSVQ
jgi:hypothetical protein